MNDQNIISVVIEGAGWNKGCALGHLKSGYWRAVMLK